MTLTYTKYFRFPKTDFMSEPWIQGVWDSFDAIDALMYSQAAANGTTVWLNLTQYGPGRTVIDVTDGSTWICTTAHTSAAVPTSFAQDRTANPSFWTAIMLSIQVRGQWRNNTAYNSGDMVYDTTAGRNIQALCVTKHISNAAGTINDDAAYWGFTYNSLAPTTASGIGYSNAASHLVAVNVQTAIDEVVAVKAPINSPAFTGAPTAPTPVPPNTNNNYIATTAFVTSQLSSQTSAALPAMDGVASAGALATFSRGDHVHPTDTSRAPLNSPAFTGTPSAPTPTPAVDSSTKLATTAFVQNAVIAAVGGSVPPSGTILPLVDAIPPLVGTSGAFSHEDHVHPTDTSRVAKAGDTMTGSLTLSGPGSQLLLRKAASGQETVIISYNGSAMRWAVNLGNTTAEGGGNVGSNFEVARFTDAGAYVDSPLVISRQSGNAQLGAGIAVGGVVPTSTPGNGNANTGFELWYRGAGLGSNLYSSVNVDWNANWSRTTTGTVHTFVMNGGGWAGSIAIASSTTATYNTSSGAELKEDLKSFDAGNIIDKTNVYDFAWKSTKERAYGVIAQQAVEIYPQAVTHHVDDERDWWGVDYSKYVPVLLQELKSLRARIAALEDK